MKVCEVAQHINDIRMTVIKGKFTKKQDMEEVEKFKRLMGLVAEEEILADPIKYITQANRYIDDMMAHLLKIGELHQVAESSSAMIGMLKTTSVPTLELERLRRIEGELVLMITELSGGPAKPGKIS